MMEPIIKVRYKRWVAILGIVLMVTGPAHGQGGYPRCNKVPKGTNAPKTEGTNGFAVTITGSPLEYRPNQVYTISLKNIAETGEHRKFQGFMLVTEPAHDVPADSSINLGSFQLMPGDAMVKFSHRCSNAVEATSSISKSEVQVYWKAPPRGSGCINFKAMVEERKDVWYADDGSLTYTLCEDDSPLAEPPVVTPCCACDEAKYEAIFEGIWSRHTHPKDFPPDEWRTEFSQIIGASHSMNYSLWEYGRLATPALQLLGEQGVTTRLEQSMKVSSAHIRSVIKAHGLQQRSNLIGQTFAVFRVDPTHHLVSLVSKMIPSPDWIVGLSKENLCLLDCSWVPHRVIDLYPWDIGTQSGLRYDSPDMPTRPRQPIQRITSSNPDSPDSPFYDETSAPMKPVARLHLILQREYTKACPPGRIGPQRQRGPWGSMGGIDAMGGALPPLRNNPMDMDQMGIGDTRGYGNPMESPEGSNSPYGNDFGNSYTYGEGIGTPLDSERFGYTNEVGEDNSYYDTSMNNNYDSPMQPEEEGNYNLPAYNPNMNYNYNNNNDNQKMPEEEEEESGGGGGFWSNFGGFGSSSTDACEVTEWSRWTQCSATCGFASRTRSREYVDQRRAMEENCQEQLLEKERCRNLPRCETRSYNNYNTDDSFIPFPIDDQGDLNRGFRGIPSDSLTATRSYTYESGGRNPLPARYEEMNRDKNRNGQNYGRSGYGNYGRYAALTADQRYGNSYTYGGSQSSMTSDGIQRDSADNCQVSEWGEWSHCSTKCQLGIRTRQRTYVDPSHSFKCSEELSDVETCFGESEDCPNVLDGTSGPFEHPRKIEDAAVEKEMSRNMFETPSWKSDVDYSPKREWKGKTDPMCAMTDWSPWSPCSSECGTGTRRRTRLFKIPFVPNRKCDVLLIQKEFCYGTSPTCTDSESESDSGYLSDATNDDYELTLDLGYNSETDQSHHSTEELYIQPLEEGESSHGQMGAASYQYGGETFESGEQSLDHFCNIEPDEGPCSGHFLRWHYDPVDETCKEFFYKGCNGNRNNFPSKAKCEEVCGKKYGKLNWQVKDLKGEDDPFKKFESLSSIKVSDEQDIWNLNKPLKVIDCQVSAWSEWSTCSKSCGIGWKTKSRRVMVEPENGGRSCPRKLVRRKKCRNRVCSDEPKYFYYGSWRHMVSNDDIQRGE